MEQKLTQQQLAEACGISANEFEEIEQGRAPAPIATLLKIGEALTIPLSGMMDETQDEDLLLQKRSHRQSQFGDAHMGYSYEWLANRSSTNRIEPILIHVTPKNLNLRQEAYTHSQDEFIFILEGAIYLLYGEENYYMEKGDSAFFAGSNSHLFIPVDDHREAHVLAIFVERG